MMCSFWFDATTLWTLKYHLSLSKPHLLNHLLGCVSFRNSTLKHNNILTQYLPYIITIYKQNPRFYFLNKEHKNE